MDLKRTIIKVAPEDNNIANAANFLQGLITNDINFLEKQKVIYSCLLNNKGRYLYDFFVTKYNNCYLIEIATTDAEAFIQKLNFYKLLSKITITPLENVKVYALNATAQSNLPDFKGIIYTDPRHKELPLRLINVSLQSEGEFKEYIVPLEKYIDKRYSLSIPESSEMVKEKAIPIVYGMDELNALNYNKGCYLGQEFTNSAKHRLQTNKRVSNLIINSSSVNVAVSNIASNKQANQEFPIKVGDEIVNTTNEVVGKVIGVYNNNIMAVIKTAFKNQNLSCKNMPLTIMFPKWATIYTS